MNCTLICKGREKGPVRWKVGTQGISSLVEQSKVSLANNPFSIKSEHYKLCCGAIRRDNSNLYSETLL